MTSRQVCCWSGFGRRGRARLPRHVPGRIGGGRLQRNDVDGPTCDLTLAFYGKRVRCLQRTAVAGHIPRQAHMTDTTLTRDDVKDGAGELAKALEAAPGVYEVMRLYEQYQRVLDQCRPYLVGRTPHFSSSSSSDRTG